MLIPVTTPRLTKRSECRSELSNIVAIIANTKNKPIDPRNRKRRKWFNKSFLVIVRHVLSDLLIAFFVEVFIKDFLYINLYKSYLYL